MADYLLASDNSNFMKCLTICHDCTILKLKQLDGTETAALSGASLDEQCLLEKVKKDDVAAFLYRTAKSITVRVG